MKKMAYYILVPAFIVIFVILYTAKRSGHGSGEPNGLTNPSGRAIEIRDGNLLKTNLFVATQATNIDQWRAAFPAMKNLRFTYMQEWQLDNVNDKTGVPLLVQGNGHSIRFNASGIFVMGENGSGAIAEAAMRSVIMDIAEAKVLGVQICEVAGHESTNFLTWCDNQGTGWGNGELYAMSGRNVVSFKMLHSFNPLRPWMVYLMIQP